MLCSQIAFGGSFRDSGALEDVIPRCLFHFVFMARFYLRIVKRGVSVKSKTILYISLMIIFARVFFCTFLTVVPVELPLKADNNCICTKTCAGDCREGLRKCDGNDEDAGKYLHPFSLILILQLSLSSVPCLLKKIISPLKECLQIVNVHFKCMSRIGNC